MFYRDPFDKDYRKMMEKVKQQKFLDSDEVVEMTTSYVPGTTLSLNRVGVSNIGFAVYDTPGVLNKSQPFNFIRDMDMLKFIQFTEDVKPFTIELHIGKSLWIGAIARIDLLSVCL